VTSALQVFKNDMRYINSRFTFTYFLLKAGDRPGPTRENRPDPNFLFIKVNFFKSVKIPLK